jgi:hypothetical protein
MTALGFFCPAVAVDGGNEPAGGVPVFFAVATDEVLPFGLGGVWLTAFGLAGLGLAAAGFAEIDLAET